MSCDNGFRTRNVTCINGQTCSLKTKPHLNESCFHPSCSITTSSLNSSSTIRKESIDVLINTSNSSVLDKALNNSKSVVTSTHADPSIKTTLETSKIFKNKETDDYDENFEEIKETKQNFVLKIRKSQQFSTLKPAKKFISKVISPIKKTRKLKVLKKNFIKPKKSLRSIKGDIINADVLITVPHKFFLNSTIIQSSKEEDHFILTTTSSTTATIKELDQTDYFFDNDMDILSKELDEFEWHLGEFTNCSRGCGNGFRSRIIECISTKTGEIVDDFNCMESKPTTFEACNTQPCLEWNVTEWSDVR